MRRANKDTVDRLDDKHAWLAALPNAEPARTKGRRECCIVARRLPRGAHGGAGRWNIDTKTFAHLVDIAGKRLSRPFLLLLRRVPKGGG